MAQGDCAAIGVEDFGAVTAKQSCSSLDFLYYLASDPTAICNIKKY